MPSIKMKSLLDACVVFHFDFPRFIAMRGKFKVKAKPIFLVFRIFLKKITPVSSFHIVH